MKLFDQERATNLMEAAGVDCLRATSKHNVAFLSDYWHAVSDDYYVLWDTSVTHKTFAAFQPIRARGVHRGGGQRSDDS